MYEPRTYRYRIESKDLVAFNVTVKETDLYIRASRNLRSKALKAIKKYRESLTHDPGYLFAYNNLATAQLQKGEIDEAITNYEKAIKINPRYAKLYNNIATAYLRKGEKQKATQYYQMALKINPEYEKAKDNLQETQNQ